ncbi:hypothetical protein GLE_4855 [Lysobacter enzymogenes]|uniref:DUF4124 domain-containing protein n=1 Tax=Lysobacter enzymogenes TaxID=69 RepID=A0A0S2DNQ8_LYSEN|nr:DUF4124 domain-containing protein [Lysobacter enzymogenes]ALN60196.1 hypothetical protein GLE_4855 [Lysobacter enzymogenes]
MPSAPRHRIAAAVLACLAAGAAQATGAPAPPAADAPARPTAAQAAAAPARPTAAQAAAAGKPSGEVLIYRCTDARGQLSLRDTPCAGGERQQTVSMVRPVDPPPRPTAPAPASAPVAARAPAPATQVVVLRAPQPMYDCVRPDGSRYVSDNGDGNPRMMPLVDLGYGLPVYPNGSYSSGSYSRSEYSGGVSSHSSLGTGLPPPQGGVRVADSSTRIAIGGRHGHVSYSRNSGYVVPGGYDYGYGAYYGSQLVRDECHPLPQQEVCAQLRDQRWAGDRRYNSALQSERARITEEQRVIDARLNADCGAY